MTDREERVPPEAVGMLIEKTTPANLVKLARKLWAFQTFDEQSELTTKYSNGVGYNSADAPSIGLILRHAERGVLSDAEASDLRSRLFKYRRQLSVILSPILRHVDVDEVEKKLVLEVTLFAHQVEHQTQRAVKFRFRQNGTDREFDCWFPKKQVEWREYPDTGHVEVYVPLWMALNKDLCDKDGNISVSPGTQVSWGRKPDQDVFHRPDDVDAKRRRLMARLRRQKQESLFDE